MLMTYKAGLAVILFICFDIITGWFKALSTGTFSSSIMRSGLWHKIAEIIAMVFAYFCEYAFNELDIPFNIPFVGAFTVYIVIMETASIIENLSKMNPELAGIFRKLYNKDNIPDYESGEDENDENKSADSR